MITREMLIDAVGKLTADVTDGTWGLSDDCMHPAIVELFDHLPAVPEPGATRPLRAVLDVGELGPEHIGYRVATMTGMNRMQELTIAEVLPGVMPGDGTRVTFVEYPGHHLDLAGKLVIYAPIEPTKPTEPDSDAHPDLIDRSHDVWRWYEGYGLNDPGLWDRGDVEGNFGPVRDA